MKPSAILAISLMLLSARSVSAQQIDSTGIANMIIDPIATLPKFTVNGPELMQYVRWEVAVWKAACNDSIDGKLFLQFTVTATGEITDVTILKEIGQVPVAIRQKAVQLIARIKAFEPANLRGKPVRMRMVVPFVF